MTATDGHRLTLMKGALAAFQQVEIYLCSSVSICGGLPVGDLSVYAGESKNSSFLERANLFAIRTMPP
jgi:hypothetical protein